MEKPDNPYQSPVAESAPRPSAKYAIKFGMVLLTVLSACIAFCGTCAPLEFAVVISAISVGETSGGNIPLIGLWACIPWILGLAFAVTVGGARLAIFSKRTTLH